MECDLKEKMLKSFKCIGEFSTIALLPEDATIGDIAYCYIEDNFYRLGDNGEWYKLSLEEIDNTETNLDTQMSLYDLNKNIIEQIKPLSKHEINKKVLLLNCFHGEFKNHFYMLLFRDINYYTLFNLNKNNKNSMVFGEEVIDCLKQFTVYSIEKIDNKIEIWINKDEEIIVGYLFPYDAGVVDFRG